MDDDDDDDDDGGAGGGDDDDDDMNDDRDCHYDSDDHNATLSLYQHIHTNRIW